MKIGLIITGMAGFIGFNFLLKTSGEFHKHYDKIISIDKMGYATQHNRESYISLCKGLEIECYNVNINDIYKITKFSQEFTWDILDFASESHVDSSIKNPASLFNENSTLPSNLLSAFEDMKSIRKFVHISTDEVYGDLDYALKDNYSQWFTPKSPFLPNNPYAASKAAQDCYLRSLQHTFGLNLVTVRMANQFGPYQHSEKMLPATIKRAVSGMPIKIYGEGKNIRQWTPVTQTVKHIYDILADVNVNNTTIHLGAAQSLLTNNEVVDMWRKILKDKHGRDTTIQYIEDRKGHDKMYAIQPTLIYDYKNLNEEFESAIDHYVNL
jgi:dTDP-glucose 4,6-dehydratase